MRRFAFYLGVGFLTFGIGSFVVFKFYWNNLPEIVINKTSTEIKFTENSVKNISPVKFVCEDEALKTVWSKLEKDKTFINDAYGVIKARQIKNCRELFYEPQKVELNNDKSNEIILMGDRPLFCGSGGDCRTWLVSKVNNRYKIIFEGKAGEEFGDIQSLNKKSNNFRNLKIKLNNHWEADTFGIFRFDGKQYQINKCFKDVNSHYTYNENNPQKLVSAKLKECL